MYIVNNNEYTDIFTISTAHEWNQSGELPSEPKGKNYMKDS